MARIRTIKPDFWTDEKVVELSAFARLLFIGLWNFADDEGRMVYSPKSIKMKIFPADSLDISELFGEIHRENMITIYVVDGVEYLQVNKFSEHQKIDKRSASKLPPPEDSTEFPRIPPTEGKGKGREGEKEGNNIHANACIARNDVSCPHQEIISVYHETLPTGTRVRVWGGTRAKHLQARWREDKKRQSLDFWKNFFTYIAESKFLTGQVASSAPDRDPFVVSLDWIVNPTNFAKILEGKYHRSAA